jgi:hypothetical protein
MTGIVLLGLFRIYNGCQHRRRQLHFFRSNTIPGGNLESQGSPFYADKIEFNPTNGQLYAIRQTDTHM